ncbi:MAG: zinc ribbon domain-containing protein YjdM, partial [Ahrensia sp.]
MSDFPPCPVCQSPYVYEDVSLLICPACGHEWNPGQAEDEPSLYRDANGTVLTDGDTVTVIKDLKIKGTSQVVKV